MLTGCGMVFPMAWLIISPHFSQAAFAADRCTIIDARIDAKAFQDSFGPTIGKGPATV